MALLSPHPPLYRPGEHDIKCTVRRIVMYNNYIRVILFGVCVCKKKEEKNENEKNEVKFALRPIICILTAMNLAF